jgi:membrane-associated phospholipid phosphatase
LRDLLDLGVRSTLNNLAGRSWLFDSFVSFTQENELIKAAAIGCCFCAAWYSATARAETERARKMLITTALASVCVLATTQGISRVVFHPRPVISGHAFYELRGDQLVERERQQVRIPLDDISQQRDHDLLRGDLIRNDLRSFPSDHAAFFLAISLGIWFAAPRYGLIALLWTVCVIIFGKPFNGSHTPLDVLAGAAIGVSAPSRPPREPEVVRPDAG